MQDVGLLVSLIKDIINKVDYEININLITKHEYKNYVFDRYLIWYLMKEWDKVVILVLESISI